MEITFGFITWIAATSLGLAGAITFFWFIYKLWREGKDEKV